MKKLVLASVAGIALITAAGAASANIVGADTIVVTNAIGQYLQVSEVVATQAGTGNDVALGGSAAGGLTWQDTHGGVSTAASNAIDGIIDGNYSDGTIYHSAGTNGELDITLGTIADLSSLTIYGRTDCCSSRDVYDISIYNVNGGLLYSGVLDATGPSNSAMVSFVPEPATWAMMLVGFGGIGGMLRMARRKTVAAVA